jgi:AcrR family transcriptional regulator
MAVAVQMVLAQGGLPLSIAELSRNAKVSKALFYAYFPTQHDLFNALLREQVDLLEKAGLRDAARKRDFADAVKSSAAVYFDHVAEHGPLLHIVMRDPYMSGRLCPEVTTLRDKVFGTLARSGRNNLRLNAKEAIAAANLILTIPEEAGRLAFDNELKRERAKELCLDLVSSALRGITPAI